MKRLLYPLLLIAFALISGAMITTITAVTFASYAKDDKNKNVLSDEQLKVQGGKDRITSLSLSVSK